MPGPSFYEIPQLITPRNLPDILSRLQAEQFPHVKSLTPQTIPTFRVILNDFFNGNITLQNAIAQTTQKIIPPINYRKRARWQENLVRSEISKIFNLGVGDYLLSKGETHCYIPPNQYDADLECAVVIENKIFPITTIQNNIYRNYNRRKGYPWYPTVPLHAQCRHVIVEVPSHLRNQIP